MRLNLARRSGFNLMETMVAATVLTFVLVALGGFVVSAFHVSSAERDRAFATQKCLQMMEEMAAYKPAATGDPGVDRFGGGPDFALTTKPGAIPHQALSGNPQVNGFYKYVRQITVAPVAGDAFARQVTVSVWYAAKSALPTIPAGQKPLAVVSNVLRSTLGMVGPHQVLDVYALSIENLPHVMRKDDNNQYYPSATEARLAFEGGLREVMSMNPGLEFRTHYITRLSVGRDPYYRPRVNEANGLDVANGGTGTRDGLPSVYYYPGRVEGAPDSPRYFDYTQIGGKLRVNGTSGDSDVGAYALADQFNHAVRYAREFNAAGKPVKPDGTAITRPEDMSLRQFLEDLLTDTTGKYRNAILVNLHGELFPSLPLRPWADAAKDPGDPDATCQQRRLVTQPYRLYTPASTTVQLLVHPYFDNGGTTPSVTGNDHDVYGSWSAGHYARRGRVVLKNLKPILAESSYIGYSDGTINENDVKISVVQREQADQSWSLFGGWSAPSGPHCRYKFLEAWPYYKVVAGPFTWWQNDEDRSNPHHSGPHVTTPDVPSAAGGMTNPHWSGNDLVIDLADLDYDARKINDNSHDYGIDNTNANLLLHGRQYFPDPYLDFLNDTNDGDYPRNTARVLIEFKTTATTAQRLEVVTQLMKSPTSSGSASGAFPADTDMADPANSRAYCWVGPSGAWSNTRKLYDGVPVTDQLQLVGDPRHNPYLDARQNGLYNPYFSDFTAGKTVYEHVSNTSSDSTKYQDAVSPLAGGGGVPMGPGKWDVSYPNTADAWSNVKYNTPAYLRMWREAILRNHMVFVNPTGEPARFLGLGGEFKLAKKVDGIGDLHIAKTPYDGNNANNADDEADELFGDRTRTIEAASGTPKWHATPWLGELYPSTEWTSWSTTGNLPSGTYLRKKLSQLNAWDAHADKTDGKNGKKVDNNLGLPSFLNADNGSGPVDLNEGGHGGSRTATGTTVDQALRIATLSAGKTPYAYKISGGATPPEWSLAPYSSLRSPVDWLDSTATPTGYYNHDQGAGYFALSPFLLGEGSGGTNKAIVVADTFRPDSVADIPGLSKLMATHLVAAYFDGARNGIGASNIKPLPRAKLKSPATGQSFSIANGGVPLTWYTKWVKADGQPYSPLHTYDGTLSTASGGPLAVGYVVKFKNVSTSGPWTTARTGTTSAITVDDRGVTVDAGTPVVAAAVPVIAAQPYPTPNTATWNISGLTPGQYLLRVEAYRMQGTTPIPTHYAYHEIPLTLTP